MSRLRIHALLLLICPFLFRSSAHSTNSQRSHGIIGYGIDMYKPVCAFACYHVLSHSRLNCSVPPVADRWHGGSGLGFDTSPECFASDDAFLLSAAWCLHQRCGADGAENWMIERYWDLQLVGEDLRPKYGYSEALKMCGNSLENIVITDKPLDVPSEVATEDWTVAKTSMRDFSLNEAQHSTYALALLSSMILVPIILALLEFLVSSISTRIEKLLLAHLIYPPILRKQHTIIRLLGEAQPPTRGQVLLILLIVLLNIIFSIFGYHGSMPNIYWKSTINMNADILANRVGILSFANLPVIFLYSSRNNPLVRLTAWPLTTFFQLHRWVAYICVTQAALHSIIYFIIHIPVLSHKFTQAYWNVGFLGTVALCLILPMSILWMRKSWYEFFIDTHIILALGIIIACYYHIYCKFQYDWRYENWVLLATILWALERCARGSRVAANGLRTARVLEVDDEYFVVDIEGVKGTGMAYLYFPTLGWRVWENHPFSIMASIVEEHGKRVENVIEQGEPVFGLVRSEDESDCESDSGSLDGAEQHKSSTFRNLGDSSIPMTPITPQSGTFMIKASTNDNEGTAILGVKRRKVVTGLSFLIRREKGATARLFTKSLTLPVLVEGPYSSHLSLTHLTIAPHLICICGGVGIAPVLPVLRARAAALAGTTRLYYGTRSEGLLSTCGLRELKSESMNIDIQVRVQERWDLEELVLREAGCYESGSCGNGAHILVVVCGPASMIESVRWAVVEANKRCQGGIVRLVDESFS